MSILKALGRYERFAVFSTLIAEVSDLVMHFSKTHYLFHSLLMVNILITDFQVHADCSYCLQPAESRNLNRGIQERN